MIIEHRRPAWSLSLQFRDVDARVMPDGSCRAALSREFSLPRAGLEAVNGRIKDSRKGNDTLGTLSRCFLQVELIAQSG